MTILDRIARIAEGTDNSYLMEARNSGRKIIGYFCSYIPAEIIHAAGFIPYRMRGIESTGTELADAYYAPLNCSFVRHCFNKVLKGDFTFLDGVIFMNGCDHVRRMYDNWRYAEIHPDFLHMFFTPHILGANAAEAFGNSLATMRSAIEKRFGVEIKDENLAESIKLYNRKRALLLSIDEMRKGDKPPITGSEMLSVVMAVTAVPVEIACSLLEELLEFLESRTISSQGDVRIIMFSGCMEEPAHIRLYEESGGMMVTDGFCMGTRLYDRMLDEGADPMSDLVVGYLESKISCPRMMDDFPRRMRVISQMVSEYSADAVVVEKLKFCDMWGWEIERLRRESKKEIIPPVLAIEREYLGGASGQVKTRIQAFFEQIRNKQEVDDEILRSELKEYYVRA